MSYRGRALVISALGLSRIWYLASVIPVPDWVVRELNSLVFKFFWKGKVDLVARTVVVQPCCAGGFGVVSIQLKVYALLVQWVRRFVVSSSGWALFFRLHCRACFGQSPWDVLRVLPLLTLGACPLSIVICCWLGKQLTVHSLWPKQLL